MNKSLTIYFSVGAAMAIAWLFVALFPYSKNYSAIDIQVLEARNKLTDYQQTTLLLPEFIKTRNELAQKKAELNSSLYTKENILSLFEQFYALADRNRVRIVEITPPLEELIQINRVVPDSVGLMFLNMTLKVEGDYQDFGRLLGDLEAEPFYRGPNHCNIIGTDDSKRIIQYQIGFKSLLGNLKDKS